MKNRNDKMIELTPIEFFAERKELTGETNPVKNISKPPKEQPLYQLF